MYTLYKTVHGETSVLAYCDSPDECAQVIDRDIVEMDENAEYRWEAGGNDRFLPENAEN